MEHSSVVDTESQQKQFHITIQKTVSLPAVQKCSCCPSAQFHCPFCRPEYFKPTKLSKVRIHLDNHFQRAVLYGDYTIHRCGLGCRKQYHYHCLYCTATVLRKRDIINHVSACHSGRRQRPRTPLRTPRPPMLITVPVESCGQFTGTDPKEVPSL